MQTLSATSPGQFSAAVSWDRNSGTEIAGYRVYYGAASRNYSNSVVVGNVTTNTVPGLVAGVTYYFAVTAYNASGLESDFSNEASCTLRTPKVKIRVRPNGQIVVTVEGQIDHTYDILATQTGSGWTLIGTVTQNANDSVDFTDVDAWRFPRRYYRARQKP